MTFLRLLLIAIVPIALAFTAPSTASAQKNTTGKKTELRWTSLETAIKNAADQDKPVLVDVYTDWCGWCKKMDREVFNDPEVSGTLDELFTLAKVNGESRESITYKNRKTDGVGIAQDFGIRGYHSLIFLDSRGDMLTLIPGFVDAEKFLPIVMFLGNKDYEKMEWEAYLAEYNAARKSSSAPK